MTTIDAPAELEAALPAGTTRIQLICAPGGDCEASVEWSTGEATLSDSASGRTADIALRALAARLPMESVR